MNNSPVTNGLAELNHSMQDDNKEIRDGVTGEGQGLSEEDELGISKDSEDVNVGQVEAVQVQNLAHAILQSQQPPSQGPLICWERFLPLRSLKVLLVEDDDSTRHLVYALLRNCGYEVTAVANGVQAWKILEDLSSRIDLVLTEVVTPYLSGIGLLSKIMRHKTFRNIPVIMMSSHDSIGVVFKCLSKGAVDFLLKPIRKNELKTLWQHIWRKCHSSSGSGSESGIRTQNSSKSRSMEESDNNTGSNDGDDIKSIGLNIRNGSDNGSGTQSPWTKRAVEVNSPVPTSPWDQLDAPTDSTCAEVIHSRAGAFGNNWVPVTATEYKFQDDETDNIVMGKELKIGVPGITEEKLDDTSKKVPISKGGSNVLNLCELNSPMDDEKLDEGLLELNREKPKDDFGNQDIEGEKRIFDISNCVSEASNMKDKVMYDTNEMPSLELSLKRLRDVGDIGTNTHEPKVLRISAFSRYNCSSTTNQAPTGNVGSCSPLDNSSEAALNTNQESNSTCTLPNQRSNGSSNNTDMGSTTNNAYIKPVVLTDNPDPKSKVQCLQHPSSAFKLVQNGRAAPSPPIVQIKNDAAIANTKPAKETGVDKKIQVQHHHHHYHHYHHHMHSMPQDQKLESNSNGNGNGNDNGNGNGAPLKDNTASTLQCVSSDGLTVEGSAVNNCLNGSGSGSDYGSSTALNGGGKNMKIDNRIGGESGVVCTGFALPDRSGVEQNQNRYAQREAALNKFRQKRKERCFEKRVRYQSRKKLAEERPRVRGQFVKQVVHNE